MSKITFKGTWYGKWIHITFLSESKTGRTNIYEVIADTDYFLGKIKWYAPWRKYAFFPDNDTLYEQDCLKDIANFIEKIMIERKAKED